MFISKNNSESNIDSNFTGEEIEKQLYQRSGPGVKPNSIGPNKFYLVLKFSLSNNVIWAL